MALQDRETPDGWTRLSSGGTTVESRRTLGVFSLVISVAPVPGRRKMWEVVLAREARTQLAGEEIGEAERLALVWALGQLRAAGVAAKKATGAT